VIAEKPIRRRFGFVPGGDYKKFLDGLSGRAGGAAAGRLRAEMVTTDGRVIRRA